MDGVNCPCGNGNPDATRWCPIHHPPIKAHCMGTEFPKRDTDSGGVSWIVASDIADAIRVQNTAENLISVAGDKVLAREKLDREILMDYLPSAADLDAVAEEQRVKEKTSAKVPNR